MATDHFSWLAATLAVLLALMGGVALTVPAAVQEREAAA